MGKCLRCGGPAKKPYVHCPTCISHNNLVRIEASKRNKRQGKTTAVYKIKDGKPTLKRVDR